MARLPADIHLHSKYCGHAVGELEDYLQRGIELGLEAVGFSFHLPVPIPTDYKVNITREELDLLVRQVEELRESYRDDIPVLLGGEADYLPGSEREVEELVAAYPFDHVIGSVHFIGEWAFDHPAEVARYDEWDLRELYATYFRLLCDAMGTGLFDIVGHVDLVKKFGHRPAGEPSQLIAGVCETARSCDLAVEINTAGLDKPVGEPYASAPFVRGCFQAGVPICFGSDAHAPGEVGRYFDQAVALARSAGYATYARFEQRRRHAAPIPLPPAP
ncbi:MAG: histidinol-phosphatase HisJ family protein [Candidatus Brocadiia bacterium]